MDSTRVGYAGLNEADCGRWLLAPGDILFSHINSVDHSFRRKARFFLQDNENHIAVIKLRQNQQLTPLDLQELERIFLEAGIASREDVEKLEPEGGLGLFVRSLVGLDRGAAKAAFAEFLAARTCTPDQIEFVNIIIDHLTDKGQMDPALLYESPFTDIDPMGVNGVFNIEDARAVVEVLKTVRGTAALQYR